VKLIKLYLMGLFLLFRLRSKRIGIYQAPPEKGRVKIGFFKRNREIAKVGEKHRFEKRGVKHTPLDVIKPRTIAIVRVNGDTLVSKKYIGFRGNLRFYSELICLHLLKDQASIPKVRFVDYANQEIYMDFQPGVCLNGTTSFDPDMLSLDDKRVIEKRLQEDVRSAHLRGVIIYDVQGLNVIIYELNPVIIDFADSLPAYLIPGVVHSTLFKRDLLNLEKNVFSHLYAKTCP
jgi:hypothetical protein